MWKAHSLSTNWALWYGGTHAEGAEDMEQNQPKPYLQQPNLHFTLPQLRPNILLVEEILHHLECIKPWK